MVIKKHVLKSVFQKPLLALALAAGILGSLMVGANSYACSDSPYIGSICVVAYTRGCPSGFVQADGRTLQISSYQALYSLYGTIFGGNGTTTFGVPDLRGREPVGVGPATQAAPGNKSATSAVMLGQYRGQESVTLTANNVPAHNHTAMFSATTGSVLIAIPAQTASGSIIATAATDIVPGSAGVDPAPNVSNYYLTGVSTGAAGPVTTTVPGANKSTLNGTNVIVNSSTYKAATAAQTVNVNIVTGGAVTVNPTTSQGLPTATLPPQLGLYYCIATLGLYPSFD